jgi:uncharacterized protein YrrD
MTLLMQAGDIIRLPVVTINGGEDVAEVKDVVYDPSVGRLVGLTLNKRGFLHGRLRHILMVDSIAAIGRDAVMIHDESVLSALESASGEVANPPADRNVVGDDVLTETGVSLGTVRDLLVLVGGVGEVVGYRLEKPDGGNAFIPLPAQLAVSGVALVVPDATEQFVRDDLVGLGAAVEEFRSKLGRYGG